MGRKIDMKKIENVTKCQVTFSKRRSSLMKKANEIAVCCDIDVAFVAFSPSGRVSKFSNQKRIEDVLQRYVNLPADKRLNHINNVQYGLTKGKWEKLEQLCSKTTGDTSKLRCLDNRIENLRLEITSKGMQQQILETALRDYEIGPEIEPSLHQLSWCERNLNHSLQRVIGRKREQQQLELESQSQNPIPIPIPSSSNQNEQVTMMENPISAQILMQLDPWISPYNARARESIFQEIVGQATEPINDNNNNNSNNLWPSTNTLDHPIQSIPIQEPPLPISSEQCLMMDQPAALLNIQEQNNINLLKQPLMIDQPLFNFHEQNTNVDAYCNNACSSVVYSDAVHMSTQGISSIQDPRSSSTTNTNTNTTNPSTSELLQSIFNEGSGYQSTNSNLMSQFGNMEGSQEIGNLNICDNNIFFNANNNTGNHDYILGTEDFRNINVDQTQINYQEQGAYSVPHHPEACPEPQFDNLLFEEPHEDNSIWSSTVQKSGSLWEWDDLLLDENFNFQNLPPL